MPASPITFEPASPATPVYPVFPLPGRTSRFVVRRRLLQGGLYFLTAVTTFFNWGVSISKVFAGRCC